MDAVVGKGTKVQDKAGAQLFVRDYGQAVEKEAKERAQYYKTAWSHFEKYVNNAPIEAQGKPRRARRAARVAVSSTTTITTNSSSSESEGDDENSSGSNWESDGKSSD